jgi:hypothetical protein
MAKSTTLPEARQASRGSRRAAMMGATLLLVTLVLPAPTAAAVSIDAECLGTFARTFSPPVTSTPQTVTVTGNYDYSTCVVGPAATGTETDALTLSCIPVTAGPPITETLTWSDTTGGTSTIAWSAPTIVGQTVVYTGTVTAGRHAGDTATKITSGISYVGSVIGCLLGTPISSTTGLVDSLLLTH